MKRFLVFPIECAAIAVLALLLAFPPAMFAQDHVVSPSELQRQMAASSALRRQNQEQLERFLSTARAQQALKSAHVNYRQMNRAISQLSDSELAMLAQRTANAQKDFAAGAVSNGKAALIAVGAVALVLLIVLATR